jgi:hypothetical protein
VNWLEFQDLYERQWLEYKFIPTALDLLFPLSKMG